MTEINHPWLGLALLIAVVVLILVCSPPPGAAGYRKNRVGFVPAGFWPLLLCGGMVILIGVLLGAGFAARM